MSDVKSPGVAAVLSAVIPGLGQFYNGDFLRGIFWLIVTPGMWIGTGGVLGWVCHVIAVDGVIKLAVNGKVVNGASGTSQKKGYLCLQSEGAEIHFRNIRLRPIEAQEAGN